MDPITIGLGAVSLGSKLFSSFMGGKANRKNQRLLNEAIRDNEARYNNNAKRSYMDTNAAKGIVEQLRKQYKKQSDIAENTASVTGGSDEARIAAKGQINEGLNDAMNQVAQQATAYQQGQEDRYVNEKNSLFDKQMQINTAKAENASNLASMADGLMSTAMSLPGGSGKEGKYDFGGLTKENRAAVNNIAKSVL